MSDKVWEKNVKVKGKREWEYCPTCGQSVATNNGKAIILTDHAMKRAEEYGILNLTWLKTRIARSQRTHPQRLAEEKFRKYGIKSLDDIYLFDHQSRVRSVGQLTKDGKLKIFTVYRDMEVTDES